MSSIDQAALSQVRFNPKQTFVMPTLGAEAIRISAKHPHYTTDGVAKASKLNRQAVACLFRKLSEEALAERKFLDKGKTYMWNTAAYQTIESINRVGFISVGKAKKTGALHLIRNRFGLSMLTEDHYLVLKEINKQPQIDQLELSQRLCRTVPYVLNCLQQLRKVDLIETRFDVQQTLVWIKAVAYTDEPFDILTYS